MRLLALLLLSYAALAQDSLIEAAYHETREVRIDAISAGSGKPAAAKAG